MKIRNKIFKINIIALFVIFLPFTFFKVTAQNILNYRETKFNKLSKSNSLPDNFVYSIIQDKQGFIWMATGNGLVRFDGIKTKIYQTIPGDSTSLHSNILRIGIINLDSVFYISTSNGVAKFYPQKEQFSKLEFSNSSNINKRYHQDIISIILDSKKRLWIFTQSEGFVVDIKTQKLIAIINLKDYGFPQGISGNYFEDKDGYMWFAGASYGFFRIGLTGSNVSVKIYNQNFKKNLTIPVNAWQFHENKAGDIYFSNNGLFILPYKKKKTDEFQYIDVFEGRSPKDNTDFSINSIQDDKENKIWICTANYGIKKYDPVLQKVENLNYKVTNEKGVTSNLAIFWLDNEQNIWLFFENHVISKYDYITHSFIEFQHDPSNLNSQNISYYFDYSASTQILFQDRFGVYWSTTVASKANFFDLKKCKFSLLKNIPGNKKSLSENNSWGIYQDSKDFLFIGVQGSMNILDMKTGDIRFLTNKDNQNFGKFGFLTSFFEYSENELWIGSIPPTCVNIDKERKNIQFKNLFRPNINDSSSFSSWWPICFFRDSRNEIYIGTGDGLEKYIEPDAKHPTGRFIHFRADANKQNTIVGNTVWNIAEDNKNRLWISTSSGLSIFNAQGDRFTNFVHNPKDTNSISSNMVKMCLQDSKGRYWITTEGGGLNQYLEKENKFVHFNKSTGFLSDDVFAVYDDNSGNLWMSTKEGIIKFNPETKQSHLFSPEDGLQGEQFSAGSFFRNKDGRIYFGGSGGVNHFYPDSIKLLENTPNIVFVSFKVFDKEIVANKSYNGKVFLTKELSYCDEVVISYQENVFSIEFAALDYSSPRSLKYKYKMDGVHKQWYEVDADNRRLSFTNLPSGEYILKVKSTNSDGVWCENEKSIKIIITPPFWQTWWFRILILIILVVSAFLYFRYKTNEIRKRNEELERKVTERTHEVMQQKEELQQQAEELEAINEELIAQSDALRLSNVELEASKYETEKAFSNSNLISKFGQIITSTFDIESINEMVYSYIKSLMPTDAFGIGIFNPIENQLEYIGFIENDNKIDSFVKKLESTNSLSAWCYNNQKIVFINNLQTEYINFVPELPNASTQKTPQSIIHIPLSTQERKLGILAVNSFNPNAYTEQDLINIQSLASYISIAIDNANAYKSINEKSDELAKTNEKLKELDQFKEGMTGMIVHDLKNPLNAVIGISSMFQEDDMWLMVNSAGNQMLNLVLNILDVQKFENTEVKLNLVECPALNIVKEGCKQVSLLIKQKNLSLNIQVDPSIIIKADQEIIVRVFVNMLTNAIKYTPNGGNISIKSVDIFNNQEDVFSSENIDQKIKDNFSLNLPFCLFSVTDTGQGIPKDKQHLVFEKFGQIEAKKSGGVRSTGLGMTFCKMVIEAHGGTIWLTSEVGVGTSFWFTLPFIASNEMIEAENPVSKNFEINLVPQDVKENYPYKIYQCVSKKAKEIKHEEIFNLFENNSSVLKIMAVDDDLYSINVYREYLCDLKDDFFYIQTIDLVNTLRIATELMPDIILMDWEMPEISGIELIKHLKHLKKTEHIPIVMTTSRSGNQDIKEAFDTGVIDYIKKPIDKTEMINRMNWIIDYSKFRKPLINKDQVIEHELIIDETTEDALASKLSILYAEDNELRSFVTAFLKDNYIIIEAENGKEGLAKALEFIPDLIISDIDMPEMNGIEFCSQLRSNPLISHIPFILLTAQQSEDFKIESFNEGADDYLNKPFNFQLLVSRINNLIKIRKDLRKQFMSEAFTDYSLFCKSDKDKEFLGKLQEAIENNLSDSAFDVDKCAGIVGLSRATLYRKLQSSTGITFNVYLKIIRLKKAAT